MPRHRGPRSEAAQARRDGRAILNRPLPPRVFRDRSPSGSTDFLPEGLVCDRSRSPTPLALNPSGVVFRDRSPSLWSSSLSITGDLQGCRGAVLSVSEEESESESYTSSDSSWSFDKAVFGSRGRDLDFVESSSAPVKCSSLSSSKGAVCPPSCRRELESAELSRVSADSSSLSSSTPAPEAALSAVGSKPPAAGEDAVSKLSAIARAKLVVGSLIREKAKADGAVCPPVTKAQVVPSAVCPPRDLSSSSASSSSGGGGVLE